MAALSKVEASGEEGRYFFDPIRRATNGAKLLLFLVFVPVLHALSITERQRTKEEDRKKLQAANDNLCSIDDLENGMSDTASCPIAEDVDDIVGSIRD